MVPQICSCIDKNRQTGRHAHRNISLPYWLINQHNLVPVKGRWCPATGKVTVGLASHWPCVTDFSGLSTFALTAWKGRWAPRLHSSHFTFSILGRGVINLTPTLTGEQMCGGQMSAHWPDQTTSCSSSSSSSSLRHSVIFATFHSDNSTTSHSAGLTIATVSTEPSDIRIPRTPRIPRTAYRYFWAYPFLTF